MRDRLGFVEKVASLGPVATLRLFGRPFYLITTPELVQDVMVKKAASLKKDPFFNHLRRIMGQGLATSENPLWRRQRKIVSRVFTPRRLGAYAEQTVETTRETLERWCSSRKIELRSDLSELTLEVLRKTLFGGDLAGSAEEAARTMSTIDRYYQQIMASPLSLPAWWPSPQNVALVRAIRGADEFIEKTIATRRADGCNGDDFLSALLQARDENGAAIDDRQIRDECMTVFIAGHDTNALALTYTFYLLCTHPEAKNRIRSEVLSKVGERSLRAEDVEELTYTKCVLKEAMRLFPPAWGLLRQSVEDLDVGGYSIPAGSTLMFSQWVEHHNPAYFPDPYRFDPARWDGERARAIPKFAYFPFGTGPRVCVGSHFSMMSLTLIVATIVQRCDFKLADDLELRVRALVSLQPDHEIPMYVRRCTPRIRHSSRPPTTAVRHHAAVSPLAPGSAARELWRAGPPSPRRATLTRGRDATSERDRSRCADSTPPSKREVQTPANKHDAVEREN